MTHRTWLHVLPFLLTLVTMAALTLMELALGEPPALLGKVIVLACMGLTTALSSARLRHLDAEIERDLLGGPTLTEDELDEIRVSYPSDLLVRGPGGTMRAASPIQDDHGGSQEGA